MNIWLHNILCDFFYPFKTQGRIILGRTVLSIHSILQYLDVLSDEIQKNLYKICILYICIKSVYYLYKDMYNIQILYRFFCISPDKTSSLYIYNIQILYRFFWISPDKTSRYCGMANLFTYFDGALPQLFIEMKVCWKAFLKGGTRR
jgi:hypothetical protein